VKSTVEHIGPTRVKLTVEVPFDELKPDFDRAYKRIAQQVSIPGFRKGKAPARILDARLGRGVVLDEVLNAAVPAKYSEAVSQAEDVKPIGQPNIEVTELADGDKVAFTAEVDVRPEITLPDLAGISVSVDDVEVTDEQVTEQLDQLRARFGTLTGVERAAAADDFVQIDLSATVDGQEVEEAQTTGFSYQVGQGGLIEGIDEAITGLSAGEERTFTSKLVAGEHADSDAEITVKVTAVKERELPEADDDFAQLASEFDTLDELTDDLRERLGRVRRMEQVTQARDKVLDEIVAAVEVPLPESIVEGRSSPATTTPCTPSTTATTSSTGSSSRRAGRARSSTPRPRRRPRSRSRPGSCSTRWRTPPRSRSTTRSSPSGSSTRPSSTAWRRRSSSSASSRRASSARSTRTCAAARR